MSELEQVQPSVETEVEAPVEVPATEEVAGEPEPDVIIE